MSKRDRLDQIIKLVGVVSEQIKDLSIRTDALTGRVDVLSASIDALAGRIDILAQATQAEFTRSHERLREVDHRLDRIEAERLKA